MQPITPFLFAIFAVILWVYTFFCVDPNHYLVINSGWNSNLIEANLLCYLISALGLCLAVFYSFIEKFLYSRTLVAVHIWSYLALIIVVVLWDNNIFSLQEAIDAQVYNSVGELKGRYKNVLDKDHLYRILFWILLTTQTIGLVNLLLSFSKVNKFKV